MAFDGERSAMCVVLHLDDRVVAGEVQEGPRERVGFLLEASGPGSADFVHLSNASVFDREHRLVARHRAVSVSRAAVRMAHEDERAPVLARAKHLVSVEDYEHAREELEALVSQFEPDAETLYVAGLVARGAERPQEALEHFRSALGLTLEEGFRTLIRRHLAELE